MFVLVDLIDIIARCRITVILLPPLSFVLRHNSSQGTGLNATVVVLAYKMYPSIDNEHAKVSHHY